ncbi:MerR family DNA-binding transcriptional regulator [Glaciihabitans sp. UYNi722]|uniref:MerR family DNA-binding transcriptional regulator n=1 Tax=Glaciihabitans sp. UYNi722 TaxID=3156344 RepID=UPI0033981556
MKTLHDATFRTIDVARRSGYSVQQVRKLEVEGVLPPASRTASGYRQYGNEHANPSLPTGPSLKQSAQWRQNNSFAMLEAPLSPIRWPLSTLRTRV